MFTCNDCGYSTKSVKDGKLECRYAPPSSIMSGDSKIIVRFPLVDPDMWCGLGYPKDDTDDTMPQL